jgi:geranylgeranyl reductase family protein
VTRVDVLVVGAGPAGSSAAYRLADAGASVVLVDRARFPRDKACGGGLTGRALRELPCDVSPVVEAVVSEVELRVGRHATVRASPEPLVSMTQRRRLDLFLAEQAAAREADFRDGVKLERLDDVPADVVLVAAGANGGLARELEAGVVHGIAFEGNAPYPHPRYRGRAVLEFGAVPGGYGWVFAKGDHVNVGVGGWASEGPRLREHLARLCVEHGIDYATLTGVRGHRLPMRRTIGPLAHGRVAAIGDAAGLVDPLTGDGMYEALLSGRLAAEAVLEQRLDDYPRRLAQHHARHLAASWSAKLIVDAHPRVIYALTPVIWPLIVRLLRGDSDRARTRATLTLKALAVLGR